MKNLRHVLQEWLESPPPVIIQRAFPYRFLESHLILSVVGVRRSGKTHYLYQLAAWLKKQVPPSNVLYVNFEDDRLAPLTGNECQILLDVYRQNFSYDEKKPLYLLLDEIQNIPLWEKTLRRLHDREKNVKIIITGSSSRLLSSEIATSLRGRTLSFNVFPFSFKEFLTAKRIDAESKNISYSPKKNAVIKALKEYLESGGFPQVVLEKNKTEILREYYRAILYRDIVERHRIKNLRLFEDFLKVVTQNMSGLFSFGKAVNFFKSMGFKVSKSTLIEYMGYIQSSFFAFEVPIFSYSVRDQLQYPRKIYLIDTGLRNAVTFRFSEDSGKLAENVVFLQLKRKGNDLYYWKNQKHQEVDFVIKEGLKVKEIIQVCWDASDEDTRKREVRAALKAMEEFNLKEALIITEKEEETLVIKKQKFVFMPLWKWLLERGELGTWGLPLNYELGNE